MPRPFCASFSPSRQSPMNLPSAGQRTVANALACKRSATSAAGGWSAEHARWNSSWSSRSSVAMPWLRNDARIIACVWASRSAGAGALAQPASTAARSKGLLVIAASCGSTLDRRRVGLRAACVHAHVHAERDRHFRRIAGEREALLAKAVVQPRLQAPHLAVRDPVRRPRREADAVARVRAQVGQFLQPNALAFVAVTGGAGEVHRAGAIVERTLAQ